MSSFSFSLLVQVEFYLNNYTTMGDVATAFTKIRYGGSAANQAAALNLALTSVFVTANGARLNDQFVNKLVVVLTDNPSTNTAATLAAASALRQAGIGVVTVGIGSNLNFYELSSVASYPFSNYSFTAARSMNLANLTDPIKRIICSGRCICVYFIGAAPACDVAMMVPNPMCSHCAGHLEG